MLLVYQSSVLPPTQQKHHKTIANSFRITMLSNTTEHKKQSDGFSTAIDVSQWFTQLGITQVTRHSV